MTTYNIAISTNNLSLEGVISLGFPLCYATYLSWRKIALFHNSYKKHGMPLTKFYIDGYLQSNKKTLSNEI